MKTYCVLFILGFCSTLSAINVFSQTTNVTVKLSNAKVEKLFSEIEKKSDFVILYKKGIVEDKTASVDSKNESIEDIFNRVLPPLGLSFHINGKQIVVVENKTIRDVKEIEQAPTITAGGTITDSNGEPLPGVSVVEKGKVTNGTMTDADGRFSFKVSPGATLEVSYIGFVKQEVKAGSGLSIVMQEQETTLDDVVVVGYGSARKIGTTIGSMQQVTSAKLQARPTANVLDALQGQVAGLQVNSNSGEPGTTQQVIMHGNGSLGASSTPLYIVDGIMVDANSIVAMNPNDFESVTLLKDASATSIYGARAANGVIVITTKRGTRNGDAKITLRTQYGISKLADRKFYDQIMTTEDLLSFWKNSGLKTQQQIDNVRNNPAYIDPKTGQLYDIRWVDEVMRDNTPTSQTDISVQGGGEKTTYFLSGGYFDQTGTSYGSEYKRYTVRSNVESQVKSWLKLGLNILASRDTRKTATDGSNVESRGMYLYRTYPWITPIDPSTGKIWEGPIPGANYSVPHLKYTAEKDVTTRTNSQVIGNFFAEISPFKGFKIISRSGADMRYYLRDRQRVPSYNFGTSANNGLRSIGNERTAIMTTNNVIEYNFDINKKHFITLLAGQEGVSYKYTSDDQEGQGITDDRLMEMRSGMNSATMGSSSAAYQFLSFFGRADYNYDDRFFADFSVRNDASSRFGQVNQNAVFWSVGAMWNMKKENFLKSVGILTDARLKASYGTQGNAEIGNYDHLALTGAIGTYNGEDAWAVTTVGNPAMTWEQQAKLTVGLRVELAGRYSIGLDFYNRKTTNMLMWVPSPFTTGFDGTTQNVGAYQNRGIDLNIGMNFVRTKDFYAGANIVFNYNKDKVLELYQGNTELQDYRGFYQVVGKSLTHYWPLNAGIDPEDGKQMWYLPGENIHETTRDKSRTTKTFNANELKQNTGKSYNTPISGGFGLNAGWKGFSVSADFSFMLGRWLWENTSLYYTSPTAYDWNQFKDVADFWTPENRDAKYPSWKDGQALQMDDFLLSNASFMRLKNLTVSYNFDKKLLEKTKVIAGLRLFVTGRNLWTVTNYIGIDPENESYGYFQSQVYPNSKQYQVGLEIVF